MINSRRDLSHYLSEDMRAHGVRRWHFFLRFRYPVLAWQRHLRRVEFIHNTRSSRIWRPYVMFRLWRLRDHGIKLGFTIPVNVFGPGLSIAHWGTITVDAKARVGANCRIHPGTAIGHKNGRSPTLGDDCYVGPGAKIFGGVTLGSRVMVGANAVVNSSFEDGSILVGVPARKVRPSTR
jgi:serine O-acetyltransferase